MLFFVRCAPVQTDVTNEIKQANEGFLAAFNSGDTKALATNYTENAKLYPANSEVLEGTAAIEGFWGAVMKMGIKKAQMETLTAQQIGNIAIEEGRYKLFVEGDFMVDQGKYLVTWEKVNGQWKISRDIWNTNNPAPAVRANQNDSIFIIQNFIKPDKTKQFEEFTMNYLMPASREFFPELAKTVRFLKPSAPNKDGTFTYFYVMDPSKNSMNYEITLPLEAKYGKEKAQEYYNMYRECVKEYKAQVTIQTGW
jgi:ketosteroid isomerase-like protein